MSTSVFKKIEVNFTHIKLVFNFCYTLKTCLLLSFDPTPSPESPPSLLSTFLNGDLLCSINKTAEL